MGFDPQLTPEEIALIEEEESIFLKVHEAIVRAQSSQPSKQKIIERMLELRDEAKTANDMDLPYLITELHSQRSLLDHHEETVTINAESPYFARLSLDEEGKQRTILLGHHTFLDLPKLPIINWKHAPLARIFFKYREGDSYSEELPGKVAEGEVVSRNLITIERSKLTGIVTPKYNLQKGDDEIWRKLAAMSAPALAGGERSAERGQILASLGRKNKLDISALLDPDQYQMLSSDPEENLVILGSAGSGKTTVALHRLSFLQHNHPKLFQQSLMMVIVPDHGLAKFISKLLAGMNLAGVTVMTYDEWSAAEARKLGKDSFKVCDDTSAKVSFLKRHPQTYNLCRSYLDQKIAHLTSAMADKFKESAKIVDELAGSTVPYVERLEKAKKAHLRGLDAASFSTQSIAKQYNQWTQEFMDHAGDCRAIFSNPMVLGMLVNPSHRIDNSHIQECVSHTLRQMETPTKKKFRGVDGERLTQIDERSLLDEDEGVAGTWDQEDFTVMMHLAHLKIGETHPKTQQMSKLKHIVMDEAQDLSPLELRAISYALSPEGSVTVAGDSAQKIDETSFFTTWDDLLRSFSNDWSHVHHLATNYRCTMEIYNFGQHILGPLRPDNPAKSIKSGPPVTITQVQSEGHFSSQVADALQNLVKREPYATVAVIARNPAYAQRFFDDLAGVPKIRLVTDGNFSFLPGIDVTDVAGVKGLEFDYVVIPDATAAVYPTTDDARRKLHVAATRAIHQLWVVSIGKPSPLIADYQGDDK